MNLSAQARRGWLIANVVAATLFGTFSGSAASRLVSQSTVNASYVLDETGALWAWGDNSAGNLGDGTTVSRARPRRIEAPGVTRWEAVSAGQRVLAVDQAGRLWAWGTVGQARSTVPVRLQAGTNRWQRVAVLGLERLGLSLDTAGEAWGWSAPDQRLPGEEPLLAETRSGIIGRPSGVGRWLDVAGGTGHALLLADTGRVFFYGKNLRGVGGPLAKVTEGDQFVEVPVPDPRHRWVEIAAGPQQSLARLSNGEWYRWGAAVAVTDDEVTLTPEPTPTLLRRPDGVRTWRKVTAGETFLLLLSDDGRTFGLGDNSLGKLAYPQEHAWSVDFDGEPLRVFPVVPLAQQAADISVGLRHGLALGEDGLLYTWGANDEGQLGRAANGSAWRPMPVRGATPPFSPDAEPLPLLELVPVQPILISPQLAGQPGTAAEFEVHRRNDQQFRIPLHFELTSPHSLPGLPLQHVEFLVNGVTNKVGSLDDIQFQAHSAVMSLRYIPDLAPGAGVSATAGLRAMAPPWVEWIGTNVTPFTLSFPAPWSLPPTGGVQTSASPWLVGLTNQLPVAFSDLDGWVTSVEVFGICPACPEPELIGRRSAPRVFPGVTNRTTFTWVPSAPQSRWQFVTVLRDNAGSVVTNMTLATAIEEPERFRGSWRLLMPVVEVPSGIEALIEDVRPGSPVTAIQFVEFTEDGFPWEAFDPGPFPIGPFPQSIHILLTEPGSFHARATVMTADGSKHSVDFPFLAVTGTGRTGTVGKPYVAFEASTHASEAGLTPGGFRLRRYGGHIGLPLSVKLGQIPLDPGDVPTPRRQPDAAAGPGRDYQALPEQVTIPAGERVFTIPVHPMDDQYVEGNEGVKLAISPDDAYQTLPTLATALVILHDDEPSEPPSVNLSRPSGLVQTANRPLGLSINGVTGNGAEIVKLDLFADGQAFGQASGLTPPLPLGPVVVQARLTDSLGRVALSNPITIEVVPELRLLGRVTKLDGLDRVSLEAQPMFQDMVLESSPDLDIWQPMMPWRVTPTNRVSEVTLQSGVMRYLRLVPATESSGE